METLLANQSLLFLLVLANHCTSDRGLKNPYREALFSFTNSQGEDIGYSVNLSLPVSPADSLYKQLGSDQAQLNIQPNLYSNC